MLRDLIKQSLGDKVFANQPSGVVIPRPTRPVLDEVPRVVLDEADDYTTKDIGLRAAGSIQEWCETDDLDAGETMTDRLQALLFGIVDSNKDGDITEDEQDLLDIVLNAAWDYLVAKGVDEDDVGALLNDWDSDVGERVHDLVAANLPEGGGASTADIDGFVFGLAAEQPLMDAVYKKKFVVRHGQKVRINKRISGTVRLTAKQKVAIRKAQMKSHSAVAQIGRIKSMRRRKSLGVK